MEIDGDWLLVVCGSSASESAAFVCLHAWPLMLSVSVFAVSAALVVAISFRSSRRTFAAFAAVVVLCAGLRIVHVGSVRAWKPVYVLFDTVRSARTYLAVGDAGRWTPEREANVRQAPECATNYVFVIGESLTTARLPFFGYEKNTMPRLSALGERLAVWGPVRAPSPYTVTALVKLFVSDGASAPVLFRLAGWRTCFVGAQDRWSRYGSVENAIFSACERKVYLGDVLKGVRIYDEQLLPFAAEMMAEGDGRPFALFVHMYGSHFQPEDRVPPGFAEGEGLDDYDRSVRYTDEVLARLIAMLPPCTEFFFISDHGESVDAGCRHWRKLDSNALWSVPVFAYPADAARPTATVHAFVSLWRRRAMCGVRPNDGE